MITKNISYPKAILFDMDGVLIESKDAWWKAINMALTSSNHPNLSKEKFDKHLWGNDFKQSLTYLGIKENVFLDCKDWSLTYLKNVTMKEDVISTLSILQNHFSLAVITNTQRCITKKVLKQFNLTKFFEEIVCADDVTKGKPSPEMILHACKSLGISTADALVIGDTKIDFQAAQKAGCIMIGMNFDNGGQHITRISELLDLIRK
jgi:phosphoglycolate phosphatase